MERVKDLDLYLLLGVEQDAKEAVIRKAYRKKALTCHPDKNTDKEAVALFHQLSDALEVLTDDTTRKAYDNVLKARKASELRLRQLDGKRRKLRDDLEQRELEAKYQEEYCKKSEEEKLAREIERLRKQGSKQLEEEQEYMRQQLAKECERHHSNVNPAATKEKAKLKVKWTAAENSPYNSESLEKIFTKYGTVTAVVVKEKKGGGGGSALIEFDDVSSAKMAAKIETGFFNNPLKVKGLFEDAEQQRSSKTTSQQSCGRTTTGAGLLAQETDFESLVLRKLRQEEERKRLIAEMLAEDADQ